METTQQQLPVRVRFAPSPTGYLHVGGARTALYNWLYARRQGGTFILRIEDTDQERSSEDYTAAILDSLRWMGLDWDEGPYYQAKRLDLYREHAQALVSKGLARKLDDGTEAIIFPFQEEGQTVFTDMIHGPISFDNKDIKDQVLIKSDGFPAYNFACVVDDGLMGITHVVRGDDHISNTPKQIAIYQAMGWKAPKYAHIPLIMGNDHTRLSKRHGATSVSHYRDQGYTPEAFVNFLALLGWSAGDNKELMSLEELKNKFSLKRVTGKSAVFDHDKLNWINSQYLKQTDEVKLIPVMKTILQKHQLWKNDMSDAWLVVLLKTFRGRVKYLEQIVEEGRYIFTDDYPVDAEAVKTHVGSSSVKTLMTAYAKLLQAHPETAWTATDLDQATRGFCTTHGVTAADIIHPMRVVVSGKTVTPGMFEVLHTLGKAKVCQRLERFLSA